MKRRQHLAGAGAALALTILATRPAAAQLFDGNGGPTVNNGGSPGVPTVENSPPSGEKSTLSRNSVKLFGSENSTKAFQLDIGPLWSRQTQDETPAQLRENISRGAPLASEIALGMTFITPAKPFYLFGKQRTLLRILDDKSFSWSLFHQDLGGGIMIGPIEPEAGIGLSLLTADIFHAEPSIQLFTPRVMAGIGIHVGALKVSLMAHAEYLWRWFGPDYLVRGITLGIRLDAARPKSPFMGGQQGPDAPGQ